MDTNNSICLINLYFGKLPNYFEFWLNSCKYNSTIDFLLLTDDKTKYNYPQNVKVIYLSFEDIKKIFQEKFDFKISLNAPYKLCDYKPAYGYIFSQYLNDYKFWGHCDLDVIFGDLRKYLPDSILNNYDKIYKFGHFSLYKNVDRVNKSFMSFKNKRNELIYKKVFLSNKSFFFDETGIEKIGIVNFYDNKKYTIYKKTENIADINIKYNNLIVATADNPKDGKCIFEFIVKNGVSTLYSIYEKKGKIQKKEYMYIHLQKRKMHIEANNKDFFFIVPNKIVNIENQKLNVQYFNKINKKCTVVRKEYINMQLKRVLKKLLLQGGK